MRKWRNAGWVDNMHRFAEGKVVAFLTQHGKETLVAPLLEPLLGCRIQRARGYDTDQLGTFSGDTPRLESQIETARKKARIGMDMLGVRIGMGSEGAFVADPFGGLLPWNIEVVVWCDDAQGLEVTGVAQGPARSLYRGVRKFSELELLAQEAGFPEHHLLLRPDSETDPRMVKGLADWQSLRKAFIECHSASTHGLVFAENDHRAFCSPSRQAMIVRATQDLMKKFSALCPACALPGFAITAQKAGLTCRACGGTTRLPMSYILQCHACQHTQEKQSDMRWADPRDCDVCNP